MSSSSVAVSRNVLPLCQNCHNNYLRWPTAMSPPLGIPALPKFGIFLSYVGSVNKKPSLLLLVFPVEIALLANILLIPNKSISAPALPEGKIDFRRIPFQQRSKETGRRIKTNMVTRAHMLPACASTRRMAKTGSIPITSE